MASIVSAVLPDPAVPALRRFNRYATKISGALHRHYLGSPFTLHEARVLYEIANSDQPTAKDLAERLGLDTGYLSRIINKLDTMDIIDRDPHHADRRSRLLTLTKKGRAHFADIDRRANEHAAKLLHHVAPHDRVRLKEAMETVERILSGNEHHDGTVTIRDARPGDLGWTYHRQIVLYKQEYRWSDLFERYVGESLPPFLQHYDAALDRLWVAGLDAVAVGAIAIQHDTEEPTTAKLRWYFVEPHARGKGVGRKLLETALRFAQDAGYERISLWTVDELVDARRAYEKAGFTLQEETGCPWAEGARQQRWELRLRGHGDDHSESPD